MWRVELVITPVQRPRPPPKPDPTTGRLESVLILRSPDDTPAERLHLHTIRQSPTFEAETPNLVILDKGAETPEGNPDPIAAKYSQIMPRDAGFPYFFAVDADGKIIESGEVDSTFIETIQTLLK